MGKGQMPGTQPARTKERIQSSDVPSIGTPAPPIDPDDVPGLMTENPKLKRKNRPILPAIIIGLIVAMVGLGIVSAVIVQRRSSSAAVIVVGDGRIEPPPELPAITNPKWKILKTWQPGSLSSGAWDAWTLMIYVNDTIKISVHPTTVDFIPILGVYGPDGKLVAAAATRTDREKTLTYSFTQPGLYKVLVSNIGGTSGSYDIMAQSEN